jgi:hypothetical protein
MSTNRKMVLLAAAASIPVVVIAVILFGRNSPFSPKDHVDLPVDTSSPADSSMRGTDWKGPLPTAASSGDIPVPPLIASSSASPYSSTNPPPLSAIPAPIVPLPLDENVSTQQRARDIQMLTDQITRLDQVAAAADAKGDTATAAATRVRADRVRARVAALQDGGAP